MGMTRLRRRASGFLASAMLALMAMAIAASHGARAEDLDYGKPGDPVNLVVGYQPYYTQAWSGVVLNGLSLWKKYLPKGSTVEFHAGLQGAVIVNQMLAGKASIGYLGDMPAIVGASKRTVADLRIVAAIGLSHDQCNIFLVRPDAPQFAAPLDAIKWFNGHIVAVPKGSCTDRFARAVFTKYQVTPSDYLNQSIEVITSGFRSSKLDAAVVWEPTASRLVAEGLARRVATGNSVGEADGAFLDMRADLLKQRPDVVKGWLQAELDAERYLADPKNSAAVVQMAKAQTTGFDDKVLWQSIYGPYSADQGGDPVRLTLPFAFTAPAQTLLKDATAFLYTVKSISAPELPADAVQPQFAAEVLKESGLTAPVGEVKAQAESNLAASR
jgi:NitT/TauT family transport system substrate-binding protein